MTPETPAKVTATTLPDEPERFRVNTIDGMLEDASDGNLINYRHYDALLQSFNAERLRAEAAEAENVRLNAKIVRDDRWRAEWLDAHGKEVEDALRAKAAAEARAEAMAKDAGRYRKIGWAQKMHEGKLLLMETSLSKEDLHDNGREMYPLFIYDTAIEQGAQHG